MPDLQSQIPKDVERLLDDLLNPGRLSRTGQKQEVYIRKGCHFAPAITTEGNHTDRFGFTVFRNEMCDDIVEGRAHDEIGCLCDLLRHAPPHHRRFRSDPLDLQA